MELIPLEYQTDPRPRRVRQSLLSLASLGVAFLGLFLGPALYLVCHSSGRQADVVHSVELITWQLMVGVSLGLLGAFRPTARLASLLAIAINILIAAVFIFGLALLA